MLSDDGDIVRAIGYVTLYSSYLEEQIELLVESLEPIRKYSGHKRASDQIKHAKKALRVLDEEGFKDLISDLHTCLDIFKERNKYLHRQLYSGLGRPDSLQSNDPNIPNEPLLPRDLYKFANELSDFRLVIFRASKFDVPKAVSKYLQAQDA